MTPQTPSLYEDAGEHADICAGVTSAFTKLGRNAKQVSYVASASQRARDSFIRSRLQGPIQPRTAAPFKGCRAERRKATTTQHVSITSASSTFRARQLRRPSVSRASGCFAVLSSRRPVSGVVFRSRNGRSDPPLPPSALSSSRTARSVSEAAIRYTSDGVAARVDPRQLARSVGRYIGAEAGRKEAKVRVPDICDRLQRGQIDFTAASYLVPGGTL